MTKSLNDVPRRDPASTRKHTVAHVLAAMRIGRRSAGRSRRGGPEFGRAPSPLFKLVLGMQRSLRDQVGTGRLRAMCFARTFAGQPTDAVGAVL
jgi:hypothetical protein